MRYNVSPKLYHIETKELSFDGEVYLLPWMTIPKIEHLLIVLIVDWSYYSSSLTAIVAS